MFNYSLIPAGLHTYRDKSAKRDPAMCDILTVRHRCPAGVCVQAYLTHGNTAKER